MAAALKRLLLLTAALLGGAAWAAPAFVALDRATARTLVDPATHTRPTVIAFWSTECSHCKKNLALLARLARTDKRLTLATIAVEPLATQLAVPLDRLHVPGTRYAYGSDAAEALAYALDPDWHGELPRTLFFDGQGGKVAVTGLVDATTVRRHLGLIKTP